MNTWITADWHLGETRFELMGRPFISKMEMIDTLTANHNKLVAPDDWVIVVGDVCYQKSPECLPYVANFNGRKTLVRGNHDKVFSDNELKPYFDQIFAEGDGFNILVEDVMCHITHYPTRGKKDIFNLVGHIHGAWKYQLNMLNIGVDVHHFNPVNTNKIPFHFNAICNFYDNDVWVAYKDINTAWENKRGKNGSYFTP